MQLVFYQSKNSRVRHLHFHSKSYYAISLKNSPQENNYFWGSPRSISIRVWNRRNLHAEIPSILKSVELKNKQTNNQCSEKIYCQKGAKLFGLKSRNIEWKPKQTLLPQANMPLPSCPPQKEKILNPSPHHQITPAKDTVESLGLSIKISHDAIAVMKR